MSIKHLFSIIIIFSVIRVCAQDMDFYDYYTPANTMKFANYLYENQDYQFAISEYERYLYLCENESKCDVDSITFQIGMCFKYTQKYQNALNKFRAIHKSNNLVYNNALLQTGYIYFHLNQNEKSITYLEQVNNNNVKIEKELLIAANYMTEKKWIKAQKHLHRLDDIQHFSINDFKQLLQIGPNLPMKSPVKAGILSAFLPGLGKVYAGRNIDGISTLLLVGVLSWQSFSSFSDNGSHSVKGWLFGSLGTVFYLGNIYGSAVTVKVQNIEINNQFDHRIRVSVEKVFNP